MGIGSLLAGIALALIAGAYVARPLRVGRGGADLDRAIEAWVAQVRAQKHPKSEDEGASYCPHCGRRVGADDRFCAGCGTSLRGGAE